MLLFCAWIFVKILYFRIKNNVIVMVFPGERKLKKRVQRQILKDMLIKLFKKLFRIGSDDKSAKFIR